MVGMPVQRLRGFTYTKLSLTETTKTLPASLSLEELMYPGIWFSEHAGEYAAGTPVDKDKLFEFVNATTILVTGTQWLTNDQTFAALQLLGDVDLVARRVFHKLNTGNLVTYLNKSRGRCME